MLFWHYRQLNYCYFFPAFEHPFLSVFALRFAYGQEWLELESWNFIYSTSMNFKWTRIFFPFFFFFFFFLRNSPCGFIPLFRLRYLTTVGTRYTTHHTVIYWSIRNFTCSFVMVCRFVFDYGIIVNKTFVTLFTFELSNFWSLNTIEVHYRGYFVSATPLTVLYR